MNKIKLTQKDIVKSHTESVSETIYFITDIAFKSGKGYYLYDYDGKEYLDFAAGIATCNVGHCHPEVVEEVQDQVAKLMHTCITGHHAEYAEYAAEIKKVGPPSMKDGKIMFLNSGSEAIEAALKMARMISKRPIIISFLGAFHGRTMGALSATASAAKYRMHLSGLLTGVRHAIYPYCYRCPIGHDSVDNCGEACINIVKELIKHIVPKEDLAGILIEPIAGEGGYLIPPNKFITELRQICDDNESLLIYDEIQTGFGRTGKMFAYEHAGVEPDILALGKAIGGGLPLSAILARKNLMDKWAKGSHGSTFGGNPVACRAGRKTLEIIQKDNLVDNANKVGSYIKEQFILAKDQIPAIGDVRGLGLMIGVELINKDGSQANDLILDLIKESAKRGVIITLCGNSVIRISPPINITREAANKGVDIIIQTLKDLSQ